MRILVIKHGKAPYSQDIDNTLENLQELVDGYIQFTYPFNDSAALMFNEEGKLKPDQCPPNRVLLDDYGKVQEVICGTMVIVGISDIDGEITSLTDEQMEHYADMFHYPNEFFLRPDGNIGFREIEPESLEEDIEIGE